MAKNKKKEKVESVIGIDLTDVHEEEKLKDISIRAHKEDQNAYDMKENAMCFVVVGGIATIVGVLFLFLSFKRKMGNFVGINFEGFQFYVFLVGVIVGAFCLAFGITRLLIALGRRKKLAKIIEIVNLDRKRIVDEQMMERS